MAVGAMVPGFLHVVAIFMFTFPRAIADGTAMSTWMLWGGQRSPNFYWTTGSCETVTVPPDPAVLPENDDGDILDMVFVATTFELVWLQGDRIIRSWMDRTSTRVLSNLPPGFSSVGAKLAMVTLPNSSSIVGALFVAGNATGDVMVSALSSIPPRVATDMGPWVRAFSVGPNGSSPRSAMIKAQGGWLYWTDSFGSVRRVLVDQELVGGNGLRHDELVINVTQPSEDAGLGASSPVIDIALSEDTIFWMSADRLERAKLPSRRLAGGPLVLSGEVLYNYSFGDMPVALALPQTDPRLAHRHAEAEVIYWLVGAPWMRAGLRRLNLTNRTAVAQVVSWTADVERGTADEMRLKFLWVYDMPKICISLGCFYLSVFKECRITCRDAALNQTCTTCFLDTDDWVLKTWYAQYSVFSSCVWLIPPQDAQGLVWELVQNAKKQGELDPNAVVSVLPPDAANPSPGPTQPPAVPPPTAGATALPINEMPSDAESAAVNVPPSASPTEAGPAKPVADVPIGGEAVFPQILCEEEVDRWCSAAGSTSLELSEAINVIATRCGDERFLRNALCSSGQIFNSTALQATSTNKVGLEGLDVDAWVQVVILIVVALALELFILSCCCGRLTKQLRRSRKSVRWRHPSTRRVGVVSAKSSDDEGTYCFAAQSTCDWTNEDSRSISSSASVWEISSTTLMKNGSRSSSPARASARCGVAAADSELSRAFVPVVAATAGAKVARLMREVVTGGLSDLERLCRVSALHETIAANESVLPPEFVRLGSLWSHRHASALALQAGLAAACAGAKTFLDETTPQFDSRIGAARRRLQALAVEETLSELRRFGRASEADNNERSSRGSSFAVLNDKSNDEFGIADFPAVPEVGASMSVASRRRRSPDELQRLHSSNHRSNSSSSRAPLHDPSKKLTSSAHLAGPCDTKAAMSASGSQRVSGQIPFDDESLRGCAAEAALKATVAVDGVIGLPAVSLERIHSLRTYDSSRSEAQTGVDTCKSNHIFLTKCDAKGFEGTLKVGSRSKPFASVRSADLFESKATFPIATLGRDGATSFPTNFAFQESCGASVSEIKQNDSERPYVNQAWLQESDNLNSSGPQYMAAASARHTRSCSGKSCSAVNVDAGGSPSPSPARLRLPPPPRPPLAVPEPGDFNGAPLLPLMPPRRAPSNVGGVTIHQTEKNRKASLASRKPDLCRGPTWDEVSDLASGVLSDVSKTFPSDVNLPAVVSTQASFSCSSKASSPASHDLNRKGSSVFAPAHGPHAKFASKLARTDSGPSQTLEVHSTSQNHDHFAGSGRLASDAHMQTVSFGKGKEAVDELVWLLKARGAIESMVKRHMKELDRFAKAAKEKQDRQCDETLAEEIDAWRQVVELEELHRLSRSPHLSAGQRVANYSWSLDATMQDEELCVRRKRLQELRDAREKQGLTQMSLVEEDSAGNLMVRPVASLSLKSLNVELANANALPHRSREMLETAWLTLEGFVAERKEYVSKQNGLVVPLLAALPGFGANVQQLLCASRLWSSGTVFQYEQGPDIVSDEMTKVPCNILSRWGAHRSSQSWDALGATRNFEDSCDVAELVRSVGGWASALLREVNSGSGERPQRAKSKTSLAFVPTDQQGELDLFDDVAKVMESVRRWALDSLSDPKLAGGKRRVHVKRSVEGFSATVDAIRADESENRVEDVSELLKLVSDWANDLLSNVDGLDLKRRVRMKRSSDGFVITEATSQEVLADSFDDVSELLKSVERWASEFSRDVVSRGDRCQVKLERTLDGFRVAACASQDEQAHSFDDVSDILKSVGDWASDLLRSVDGVSRQRRFKVKRSLDGFSIEEATPCDTSTDLFGDVSKLLESLECWASDVLASADPTSGTRRVVVTQTAVGVSGVVTTTPKDSCVVSLENISELCSLVGVWASDLLGAVDEVSGKRRIKLKRQADGFTVTHSVSVYQSAGSFDDLSELLESVRCCASQLLVDAQHESRRHQIKLKRTSEGLSAVVDFSPQCGAAYLCDDASELLKSVGYWVSDLLRAPDGVSGVSNCRVKVTQTSDAFHVVLQPTNANTSVDSFDDVSELLRSVRCWASDLLRDVDCVGGKARHRVKIKETLESFCAVKEAACQSNAAGSFDDVSELLRRVGSWASELLSEDDAVSAESRRHVKVKTSSHQLVAIAEDACKDPTEALLEDVARHVMAAGSWASGLLQELDNAVCRIARRQVKQKRGHGALCDIAEGGRECSNEDSNSLGDLKAVVERYCSLCDCGERGLQHRRAAKGSNREAADVEMLQRLSKEAVALASACGGTPACTSSLRTSSRQELDHSEALRQALLQTWGARLRSQADEEANELSIQQETIEKTLRARKRKRDAAKFTGIMKEAVQMASPVSAEAAKIGAPEAACKTEGGRSKLLRAPHDVFQDDARLARFAGESMAKLVMCQIDDESEKQAWECLRRAEQRKMRRDAGGRGYSDSINFLE